MDTILSSHHTCLQCGEPAITGESFCCKGCEAVFELLKGLLDHPVAKNTGKGQFEYLDQPDFYQQYVREENKQHIVQFYIEGIVCASCIQALEALPRLVPGVLSSELHFSESILNIRMQTATSLSELASTIHRMGYKSYPIAPGQNASDFYRKENRTDMMKMGVAAFSLGNIMLLAVSVYGGAEGEILKIFNWLQFIFFLPVLFYSSVPFYLGAWRSIQSRNLGIDLPIAIALSIGVIFSSVSLITGGEQIYYDSMTGFVFLILSSRYLQKRLQQKSQSRSLLAEFIQSPGLHRKVNDQVTFVHWSQIQVGDVLIIKSGERLIADGILMSERASLDLSVVTGEPYPKSYIHGMTVLAGSRCYSPELEMKVTHTPHQSWLAKTMRDVEIRQKSKTPLMSEYDKASQILIGSVLAIATLFFAAYSWVSVEEAFARSLALVVIACPCALALGAPLALSQGLRMATKKGILLRTADILEKIQNIKTIAFDKTGTLTRGDLTLYESPLLSLELKSIILSLEKSSHHPIAFALRKLWEDTPTHLMTQVKELPGIGVEGWLENDFYEFKKASAHDHFAGPSVSFSKNHQRLFTLHFSDEPQVEAPNTLQWLRQNHFNIKMLTGDHWQSAMSMSTRLGLQSDEILAELKPEEKGIQIRQLPHSMLVGDGANDTLAMGEAEVSVAVNGSVKECMKIADVYLNQNNIGLVKDLILISNETFRVLRRNRWIAFIYNTIGGVLALLGLIGPLGAAILMPISSVILVLSSYFGTSALRTMKGGTQ